MPNVSRAQTVTLKMQGAWGAKDIFNDMAQSYVQRVNEMSGGRLVIEYLIAGAVVKPFSRAGRGATTACSTVATTSPPTGTARTRRPRCSAPSPVWGWNAHQGLAWIHQGGGQALYDELVQQMLGLNVVGFFAMPMPTQPLGWFKNAPASVDDLKGLKYRTVGLAADVMQAMGMSVAQLPGRRDPAGHGARRHRRLRVQQSDLGSPLRRARTSPRTT